MIKTQEIASIHIKLNAIIAEMEDKANRDTVIIRDLKCILKQIGELRKGKANARRNYIDKGRAGRNKKH